VDDVAVGQPGRSDRVTVAADDRATNSHVAADMFARLAMELHDADRKLVGQAMGILMESEDSRTEVWSNASRARRMLAPPTRD
jgi:formylmethanofuran dehydrogenase subunit B